MLSKYNNILTVVLMVVVIVKLLRGFGRAKY